MLRRIFVAMLFAAAVLVLAMGSGCNTIRGVGKDVEAGGRAIQRTAQ